MKVLKYSGATINKDDIRKLAEAGRALRIFHYKYEDLK